MMIKLISIDNKVLYELEKSELFPDYRSVLKEAIALQIDLTRLLVESECIDDIIWSEINMDGIIFKNCSMKRNKFIGCFGKELSINSCDMTNLKFKNSTFNLLHISDSNLSLISFRNSKLYNSFIIDCNCSSALFFESNIEATGFHTTNISEAFFYNSCLDDTKFIHGKPGNEWMKDTKFIDCSVIGCNMEYVDDLSSLYFWNTPIRDIQFKSEERFTEVVNDFSKVIYAIDSDVIWWKPYSWNDDKKRIFRGTLKEFQNEVENGFPTTELYPDMSDFEIEEELLRVSKYLEMWNQTKKN